MLCWFLPNINMNQPHQYVSLFPPEALSQVVTEHRVWAPCHTRNSHWPSILHMVTCMFQCWSLHPTPSFPYRVHKNESFLRGPFWDTYSIHSVVQSWLLSSPKTSSSPAEKPRTRQWSLPIPHPQALVNTRLLSDSTDFPDLDISYKRNHSVCDLWGLVLCQSTDCEVHPSCNMYQCVVPFDGQTTFLGVTMPRRACLCIHGWPRDCFHLSWRALP